MYYMYKIGRLYTMKNDFIKLTPMQYVKG